MLRYYLWPKLTEDAVETHKRLGISATEYLESILSEELTASFRGYILDRHGRPLIFLSTHDNEESYNLQLVRSGRAIPYLIYPNAVSPTEEGEWNYDVIKALQVATMEARENNLGVWEHIYNVLIPMELRFLTRREPPSKYCADLQNNLLYPPQEYYKIPVENQLFFYPKDVCIAVRTKICRNTTAQYLKEMYVKEIVRGPYICVRPAPNYEKYVYLMNFKDPIKASKRLRGFPHVLYNAMAFGDWNTMVTTDRSLDFSQLVGFQDIVKWGIKYCSYTPKVEYITWEDSFKRAYEYIAQFKVQEQEVKERFLVQNLFEFCYTELERYFKRYYTKKKKSRCTTSISHVVPLCHSQDHYLRGLRLPNAKSSLAPNPVISKKSQTVPPPAKK